MLAKDRRNDQRSRYTHQAYDVTFGGLSPETANEGAGKLLSATYDASFEVEVPGMAGTYRYNLPPHLYGTTYSVVVGSGGTATITANKLDNGGGNAVTLIAALTSVAVPNYDAALSADYPHDDGYEGQETLEIIVAGAPANDFVLAFHLHIAQSAWK